MSELNIRPGIRFGAYPQKPESNQNDLEQFIHRFYERCKTGLRRRVYNQRYLLRQVNRHQQALEESSEEELTQFIADLREKLFRQGLEKALIFEAFAVIREAADRVLGLRHYDVQLYGGWIMMNGMLAEMETGEGKTLATTLPACTAALAGIPVHVITANDYLATRDEENMAPLYRRLGLSSGCVIDGMDPVQCHRNYRNNIVHTTNKQIAFDYLRDRIEMGDDTGALRFQFRQIQRRQQPRDAGQLLLGGLCFALVDEADSVLVDEAKTPLIITRTLPSEVSHEHYADALYLASALFEDIDYHLDENSRSIEFTLQGEEKLSELIITLPKFWKNSRRRKMLVKQALAANYFYIINRQYVVLEDQVQIIDESTGRIMADRSWEQGLHQMIEAKEGCTISDPREPQARISYQRFFSRYLHLGGTSGTLSEVAPELHRVYGLDVIKVATNKRCKRVIWPELVVRDEACKKTALLARANAFYHRRRPQLIGTCSVEESEQVSAWLQQAKIPHRVLNAKQDKHEAEIIAEAGQQQAITVATNMAGRGTDISLGSGVAELGGLHVIALSRNHSRRVDRQLYGRCARQGDAGSVEVILSLEDPVLENYYSSTILKILGKFTPGQKHLPGFIARLVLRLPQQKNEREQSRTREKLVKQDRQLRRILAFSGKFE